MQNEREYPQHRYYLLLNSNSKKPLMIQLYGKYYMFITTREYFINPIREFFSLKEKLYILNFSYEVIWNPISYMSYFYRTIFFNVIHPSSLQLNITKGKVTPYISKKETLNV